MRKIIEYVIVRCETTVYDLSVKVNERIKDGWEPLGRSYVSAAGNYFQTMVRYEN